MTHPLLTYFIIFRKATNHSRCLFICSSMKTKKHMKSLIENEFWFWLTELWHGMKWQNSFYSFFFFCWKKVFWTIGVALAIILLTTIIIVWWKCLGRGNYKFYFIFHFFVVLCCWMRQQKKEKIESYLFVSNNLIDAWNKNDFFFLFWMT